MQPKVHSDGYSYSNSGFTELVQKLANLEFREFQQLVFLWLGAKGFRHMRSLDRRHRRGRRRNPGADFLVAPPGLLPQTMAVQIRHWKTPVQKRAIDELRGYMLRNGVPSGMVVSTSKFLPSAIVASKEFPGRPIYLVSPGQLAKSMLSLGLGVKNLAGQTVTDEAFFRSLRHLAFASMLMQTELTPNKRTASKRIDGIKSPSPAKPEPRFKLWLYVALALLLLLTVLWFTYVWRLQ